MFSQQDLSAYLDEALSPEDMARVEAALRDDGDLIKQLSAINARQDSGAHSLGEIWRRQGLMLPTREQLGSFLLGTLSEEEADYIRFRLDVIGCRFTRANLNDLEAQQEEPAAASQVRQRRYFESSAGYLRDDN